MTFTKLWQRYLLKEILKVFSLFLLSFFFLYALIDYSMHMQEILKNKKISFVNLSIYYGMLFSKRCDLLFPLSLLIASVKVLTSLNKRNELLAFQAAGISLKSLIRPFFFVGLLCVGLSYLNFEVFAPKSLSYIDYFEKKNLKKKTSRKRKRSALHTLPLEDGSRFLYQFYDPIEKKLFDLFWIQSPEDIYHMKTLHIGVSPPIGHFVDHMKRNEKGTLEKVTSWVKYPIEDLHLNFDLQNHFEISVENRSITNLIKMTLNKTPLFYENRWPVYTHLYFKLIMPWLPIFVLIGVIPFCIFSSRTYPTFFIFAGTIFGYIAFFAFMDGCIILGEMQVVPPFWAIFTLPLLFCFIFGPRFIKMCLK